ncbi:MAG: hypothetical protein Sapg2KO_45640 [Saprospiraceae bacterium]
MLPFPVFNPWEITYGPDDYLWISEEKGTVTRVHPETGLRKKVFTATDYFNGSNSEKAPCGLSIGANTYGLALHPNFLNPNNSFIYLIYSYNSGTEEAPATLFKIVQLTWDAETNSVIDNKDLVLELANGYDHFGGRMIAVRQNEKDYLYYSTGDTGSNFDDCYGTPADNPNNFAQDPNAKNGKIHRIYTDGTIPEDNPIPENSFFTRGHRNPQGLAYNPNQNVLYDIEHGHTTDDEINVLQAGMNYGWNDVQGYHDGNYPEELEFVQNYVPHPDIKDDALIEPLYSWGVAKDVGGNFLTWPTVAPSDGIYYGSDGIPEWTNSLLVVTLKNGSDTDQEVFQFQLNPDGKSLLPATPESPNPKKFFGEDQALNGRLRDIAVSPDGKKIFLITNNRNTVNTIIVYTLNEVTATSVQNAKTVSSVINYPNPFSSEMTIDYQTKTAGPIRIKVYNSLGQSIKTLENKKISAGQHTVTWDGTSREGRTLPNGVYYYTLLFDHAKWSGKMLLSR